MTQGVRAAAEIARVLLVACMVEVGLRISDLPRVARWCGVELDIGSRVLVNSLSGPLPRGARLPARTVTVVMRHWPFGDTCLRRCLVLGHRLRALHPVLRIGVAVDDDAGFRAHSWLEIAGQSLDAGSRSFSPFGGRD